MVDLAQIDDLLRAWQARLGRLDANLLALEGEAIYQALSGGAGARPALTGTTQGRVARALEAVTALFEDRARLAEIIERAGAVRASISAVTFWENEERIREILRLLREPSIELEAIPVALEDRALLDDSQREVRVAPEDLLRAMAARFDEAQKTLHAVARAWRMIEPELGALEAQIAALRAQAAEVAIGGAAAASLGEIEVEAAALRARIPHDPLGAESGARAELAPRVAALAAEIAAIAESRRRALEARGEARALLIRLGEQHARAVTLHARARRDLGGAAIDRLAPPPDPGSLAGLDAWLRKLEATIEAARWSSAGIGLGRFLEAAERQHAEATAVIAAVEALLGRPAELAGRLSARRAQAAALAARGQALPARADEQARLAAALLARTPLPLEEAARAVEIYEALVVAAAARR